MFFRDRIDAASRLAKALQHWRGKHPLILAIPRGAVPMGKLIADELDGDLDVVLIRKLRAPGNPELAIGAVAESGWAHIADHPFIQAIDKNYLDNEIGFQLSTLRQRRSRYGGTGHSIDPTGRVVIVVDDGLATGETMTAALHAVRASSPARLICAVPVAASQSLEKVRMNADETVCLHATPWLESVGEFYGEFEAVPEEEVVDILQHARRDRDAHRPTPNQGEHL